MTWKRGNWIPGPYKQSGVRMGKAHFAIQICCDGFQGQDGALRVAEVQLNNPFSEGNANLFAAAPDLAEVVRRGLSAGLFGEHLRVAAEEAYRKALGEVG